MRLNLPGQLKSSAGTCSLVTKTGVVSCPDQCSPPGGGGGGGGGGEHRSGHETIYNRIGIRFASRSFISRSSTAT